MLSKSDIQRQTFDPAAEERMNLLVKFWKGLAPGRICGWRRSPMPHFNLFSDG